MTKLYSYARVSTKEQVEKMGLGRQEQDLRDYHAAHPDLELDTKLTLYDKGVASFRGQNIDPQKGYLGKFIKACHDGDVEYGSVLVIERMDRFSRAGAAIVVSLITQLVTSFGLKIVFLQPNEQTIDSDTVKEPMSLMYLVMEAHAAHIESERKSNWTKKNFAKKQDLARSGKGLVTTRCPAWLIYNKETEGFDIKPEGKAAIEFIFNQTVAGVGQRTLCHLLNEQFKPITTPPKDNPQKIVKWNPSYVSKILNDKAVLGVYQPKRANFEAGIRELAGNPIDNYYPQIITEKLFLEAQHAKSLNKQIQKSKRVEFVNLLSGKIYCLSDGSTMQLQTSRRKRPDGSVYIQRRLGSYLYAQTKKGCPYSVDYFALEKIIIYGLSELNENDLKDNAKDIDRIRAVEKEIIAWKETLAGYEKQYSDIKYRTVQDTILLNMTNAKQNIMILQEEYDQLLGNALPSSTSKKARLKMLKEAIDKEGMIKGQKKKRVLSQIIKSMVDKVELVPCKFANRQVGAYGTIKLTNGKRRLFVIIKLPGGTNTVIANPAGGIDMINLPCGIIRFHDQGRTGNPIKDQGTFVKKKVGKWKAHNGLKARDLLKNFMTAKYYGEYGAERCWLFQTNK